VAIAFCCDYNGIYVGASAMVFEGNMEASMLEALTCHEALALAQDLGVTRVLVASERSSIVSDIREGSMGTIGLIIPEIRS
jgi:hypothetical protein